MSCLISLFAVVGVACQSVKTVVGNTAIESVKDSKTGAKVFTRDYDSEPYCINVGGIVKARKQQKKEKAWELLEKY